MKIALWVACVVVVVVASVTDRDHNNGVVALLAITAEIGIVAIPIWGIATMRRKRKDEKFVAIIKLAKSKGYSPDVVIGGECFDLSKRVMFAGGKFIPLYEITEWDLEHRDFDTSLPTLITSIGSGMATVNRMSIGSKKTGWYMMLSTTRYDSPMLQWRVVNEQVGRQIFNIFSDIMHGKFSAKDIERIPAVMLKRTRMAQKIYDRV